jgi:hypothetical protein
MNPRVVGRLSRDCAIKTAVVSHPDSARFHPPAGGECSEPFGINTPKQFGYHTLPSSGAGRLLMAELEAFLASAWALFLAAVLFSLIAYPFVFTGHLLYEWLVRKYEETPKFLLLALATFITMLLGLILLEQYLGASVAQTAAELAPAP